jgi:hypothetical protein
MKRDAVAGARGIAVAGGACACAASLIAVEPPGARAQTLSITSFDRDSTLTPGRTTSIAPSCGRTFSLLGTRFRVFTQSANPNDPRNQPAIVLRAVVPEPNGARFTFRNVGTGVGLIRATADCVAVRDGGNRRLSTAGRRSRAGPARLTTKVLTKERRLRRRSARGRRAGASAPIMTVGRTCGRNSTPGDFGFESRRSEFAGARLFERRGRVGIRARFRAQRPDTLALHLVCVKGRRMIVRGAIAGAGAARSAQPAGTGRPGIAVRYFRIRADHLADLPFAGLQTLRDPTPRAIWMSPWPASIPPGASVAGRGFLETGQVARPTAQGAGDLVDALFEYLAEVHGINRLFPFRPPPAPPPDAFGDIGFQEVIVAGYTGVGSLSGDDRRTPTPAGPSATPIGTPPPGAPPPGTPPPGGPGEPPPPGVAECADGVDNTDPDTAVDEADRGCLNGPGGVYVPADVSELDIGFTLACPADGTAQRIVPLNDSGTVMDSHVLRRLTPPEDILVQRLSGDSDFASGSENLGDALCGPGSTTTVDWTVNGTQVVYEVNVVSSGATAGTRALDVAANTR